MDDSKKYMHILKMMHDKLPNPNGSIVISDLYATKGKIQGKIRAADYKTSDNPLIEQAFSDGMVKLKEPNVYILTAKGAWAVETKFLGYSINDLLEKIDKERFGDDSKNEKTSDKNKVILLSLLSTRAFSKETVASYRDDMLAEAFWKILSESAKFLLENKIISTEFADMYDETGSKGKFGTLLGEIDKLQQSTLGIFVPKSSTYHLDVADEEGDLNSNKIVHIFKVIFEEIPLSLIEPLNEFCFNISRTYGILLSSYCSTNWDAHMKRCIETASGI